MSGSERSTSATRTGRPPPSASPSASSASPPEPTPLRCDRPVHRLLQRSSPAWSGSGSTISRRSPGDPPAGRRPLERAATAAAFSSITTISKRVPSPGRVGADLAAHQPGQAPADRETEAAAAIEPAESKGRPGHRR